MKLQLIFHLFTGREKRQLFFVFLAQLITGFIELAGIASLGPFISIITNPQIIHQNKYLEMVYSRFAFSSDRAFIMAFGFGVIIMLVVSNLFMALVTFINFRFTERRRYSFSVRLFEKYLRQPYAYFLDQNTAVLIRNLDNVNYFISEVLSNLLNLISFSIISLFIIFFLILLNPLLAISISLVLAFLYMVIFGILRRTLAERGKDSQYYSYLRYKYINETFGGIKDIKILKKERTFLELFSMPILKLAKNEAVSAAINELPRFLIETVAIGGMVLVMLIMISSGAKIEHFLPTLTVYAFGAYRLLPLLQRIFRASTAIRYRFPLAENLYNDFTNLPDGAELLYDADIPLLPFNSDISIESIVFSYPNSGRIILNNISLDIKHNTSVALVGPTGCGKTTMVDIILGLLIPRGGTISVDGRLIDDSNRANWQKNLGYVPQNIYLTEDTIKNNIAFGVPPDKIDMEAVIRAAKLANIHDFVSGELEQGYDSSIGERGTKLSGGQRQRIGIARAVYHDPAVLIFDEATSALDSLTENAVMDAIHNMGHKKTIIIIAHRITTVKNCDRIYMMDKGIIIDHGNYGELYAGNDLFKKMADGILAGNT
jgi:ABC-type multidrug transport system fused ATPase/permease subunit